MRYQTHYVRFRRRVMTFEIQDIELDMPAGVSEERVIEEAKKKIEEDNWTPIDVEHRYVPMLESHETVDSYPITNE